MNLQLTRRQWSHICGVTLLGSCGATPICASTSERTTQRAIKYILGKQSRDGAWRAEEYGLLRGGPELTPFICFVLNGLRNKSPEVNDSIELAKKYLTSICKGELNFTYPVYTAAFSSMLIEDRNTQKRLLNFIESHRYTTHNGWKDSDAMFGGWGYQPFVPRRGKNTGNIFPGPNLPATLVGLMAYRKLGVAENDSRIDEIRQFIFRCQNYEREPAKSTKFDDGGFIFSPTDLIRNKTGSDELHAKTPRFHSYGSTTADGLHALRLCGLEMEHPRIVAARNWLMKNFSATTHPGEFVESRKAVQNAYYFYYAWSVARAMAMFGEKGSALAQKLKGEISRRQREDGSWVNKFPDGKENDPLVATPLALAVYHN